MSTKQKTVAETGFLVENTCIMNRKNNLKLQKINFFVPLIVLCGTFFTACTTASEGVSASRPPELLEDQNYYPVLQRWTRNVHYSTSFQKRIDVSATLLTEEFRRAYAARWGRLRGTAQDFQLGDLSAGKLGLLVSAYTPEDVYQELDNKVLWNIQLAYGTQNLNWTASKRMRDKTIFSPFFNYINQWSSEYLFVFDVPESIAGAGSVVLPESVTLAMKSPLATLDFTWR